MGQTSFSIVDKHDWIPRSVLSLYSIWDIWEFKVFTRSKVNLSLRVCLNMWLGWIPNQKLFKPICALKGDLIGAMMVTSKLCTVMCTATNIQLRIIQHSWDYSTHSSYNFHFLFSPADLSFHCIRFLWKSLSADQDPRGR